MSYAIISLGGKQYRVSEGQRLLVDRLDVEEGKTITPDVLLVGGTGTPALAPSDVTVTVKVVGAAARAEDPHRQVQEAHRLQAPHRASALRSRRSRSSRSAARSAPPRSRARRAKKTEAEAAPETPKEAEG